MRHNEGLCNFFWTLCLAFSFRARLADNPPRQKRRVRNWYEKWDAQTLRDMVIGEYVG